MEAQSQKRIFILSTGTGIFDLLHWHCLWILFYLDEARVMKKIGLTLPLVFLIVFALAFHPSMRIYLMEFTNPWLFILFSPQMFFLLATILVLSKNKMHPREIGVVLVPVRKNISMGLLGGLIPFFLLAATNAIMGKISPSPENTNMYEFNNWMMFSYFILSPITEELFFRGVLFHALKENYSLMISVIASSMLFGASHSSVMVGPLMLGVITAWMTIQTKSIFPGMIFHSLSNGLPWFYANHCHHLQPFENLIFFKF
jgi:membrane protease YdiL (CAAX protease family)